MATCKADEQHVKSEPVLVIAIDFGTTNSGFAFSFKGSREKIIAGKRGGFLPKDRVPSIVLLNKDQSFNSFGFDAINTYSEMSESDRKEHFYVEFFKMILYDTKRITKTSMVCDSRCRELNAINIFSMVIKYFTELSFKAASGCKLNLEREYVQWMITIPAIWTDSARQFMREAATNAGIDADKLRLVLEPEAASLFCQEQKVSAKDAKMEKLEIGYKYILADLGGGTADICVHEILEQRQLRELYRATGGHFGGKLVNDAFGDFVNEVVGEKVWTEFKVQYPLYHFEMLQEFEVKKKRFSNNDSSITISPEKVLLDLHQKETGLTFEMALKQKSMGNVEYDARLNRLSLRKQRMEEFFQTSVNEIIDKINEIIDECGDSGITMLMVVGGFAESIYLRERLRSAFTNLEIIFPENSGLAVVNGAVMMGYMPQNIAQRRARFSYGFVKRVPFKIGKHPQSLRLAYDGEVWCNWVFDKVIEKGELLNHKQIFKWEGYNTARDPERKRDIWHTSLWRSTKTNPKYCTEEESAEEVGEIVLTPPTNGWPDVWHHVTHIIIGETEFTVKNLNKTTKEISESRINFL